MFGEYAQVATYLSNQQGGAGKQTAADGLPDYLKPSFHTQQSYNTNSASSGLTEDFIMVAEFSELEGPKPVMTIPKDGGENFDQNTFSVRILAVDHQNSSEGFSITEDAQVVLSDSEIGVYAFVHHIVLYDNTARGFVRPYCMAYITADQRKLMHFYEEMSAQFKKVARCMKYGNKMLFIGDLERHLKDLEHTKGFLLNQVSKMRLSETPSNGHDVRKTAENELYKGLQTIRQSSLEIREILSILKPLMNDKKLECRFRQLEDKAFQSSGQGGQDKLSLQENWFNDLTALEDLETRYGSLDEPRRSPLSLFKPREYKPLLVETKKAKRFNAPLRGLHELCSWGAKEGLKRLRLVHEYFKRSYMILELEKNESRLLRPSCSSLSHGHCVTGNFLTGVDMRRFQDNHTLKDKDLWALYNSHHWGSRDSLDSLDSFKSAESPSFTSPLGSMMPGSFQSYNSQSINVFESAPSSLGSGSVGISLMAKHEYYSDMSDSEDSGSLRSHGVDITTPSGVTPSQPMTFSWDNFKDVDMLCEAVLRERGKEGGGGGVGKESQDSAISRDLGGNNDFREVEDLSDFSGVSTQSASVGEKHSIDENSIHSSKSLDSSVSNVSFKREEVKIKSLNYLENKDISLDGSEIKSNELENKNTSEITNSTSGMYTSHCLSPKNQSNMSPSSLSIHKKVESRLSEMLSSADSSKAGPARISGQEKQTSNTAQCESGKKDICVSDSRMVSGDQQQNIPNHKEHFSAEVSRSNDKSSQPPLGSPSSIPRVTLTESGGCDCDHIDRERAPSDVSSYTELSVHDYFPHLGPSCSTDLNGSCTDTSDEFVDLTEASATWKPRCGLLTVGDFLNLQAAGRPGHCVLEVLGNYGNMQHVLASLLSGRTVLVAGAGRLEAEVVKVVTALSVFVPVARRKKHAVLEWTSKPLRVADLTKLKLVGVCRPERKTLDSFIPGAIKQACTILDLERRLITAPPYTGQLVNQLLSKKKVFKTDTGFLAYLEWWLMHILSKAFIFFHSFCLGSAGSILYSHNPRDQRDAFRETVSGIMGKLEVKDSDCAIVEYLAELAKLARLEAQVWRGANPGSVVSPLHLELKACQTIKC